MGEPYEVQIKTTADPSGAEETKAALAGVGDAAVAIDGRQAALAAQKQEIAVAQLKALQAEALGQEEVAATLQREVSLRSLALRLQQESNISEAEAVAIARARSVEDDKIYGKAGKFKLLQNLGVDSGTAKTLGIAALAGFQLSSYIEEASKYYDDLRITGEKESAELQKQVESWRQMSASAKDLNDVQKLNETISKTIAESYGKLRELPSEGTKGFFQNSYDALVIYDTGLRKLIGDNKTYKTSTDEAGEAQENLIAIQQSAQRVYAGAAEKSADAVRALLALPYAEGVEKAREQITQLVGEQENLNRSDAKQEQSWQRKQSQIEALSSAISQLVERHEVLARKEQLEADVATATDPTKRAAAQKELEDLRLKLLVQDQIQKAAALAAASGKALSDAERKAIEDQLKPLQAKLELLRELAKLNPAGGYQPQIDKLTNAKPPSAQEAAKTVYAKIIADANSTVMEVTQAKARLELVVQQELRDLAKTTPPPPVPPPGRDKLPSGLKPYGDSDAISQGVEEIGRSVADGTNKIHASIEASAALIKPAFDPVAEAMNQIPDAFNQGAQDIVSAVNTATENITSNFTRAIDRINLRVTFLEGRD